MGKATSAGWSLRRVRGGHTHRESRGPSPLGPGGTPLEPALTHSTSGAVTGSNARLGTSKDLSSGHETPYRHSRVHDIRTTLLPATQITRCSTRVSQPRSRFIPSGSFHDLGGVARVHAGDLGSRRRTRPEIRGEISPRNFVRRFFATTSCRAI